MDYSDVLRLECAKEFRLPKSAGEDNWKSRMDFCNKMTAAIDSYGTGERLPKDFSLQIEPYFNNLLDCALSERTQLSNSACKLLAALPRVLGRDMHPHLDRILPVLIKLCANTKQVTVKMAAASVASILQYSTYSPRLLWHVCQVFEDKPAGPKQNATSWLQTLMKEYHRSIGSHKDSEMISRALLLALEDADASVRTSSRATYWTYYKIDADGAAEIMEKLNSHARTALQNDPHNPEKKGGAKNGPPRPKSALADVRKEQAKKKRAEEEALKQRKALNTSTASHDSAIEVHEPPKTKYKSIKEGSQPENGPTATPALDDRRHKEWQRLHTDARKTHKKALSNDDEVIIKPSASSRLLSAPVRRPRINVTPINPELEHLPNARPASRTDHTAPNVHSKEPKKLDSRPTSSSSSKSASTGSWNAANSLRANVGLSYVPDGKENAASFATVPKKIRAIPAPGTSPEKSKEEENFKSSVRGRPPQLDRALLEHQTMPPETAAEPQSEQRKVQAPRVFFPNDRPLPRPEQPLPKPDQPGYIDGKAARNYLTFGIKDLSATLDDLIRCKKLKGAIEQHPDLISKKETWNELFDGLCYALVEKDELNPDTWATADHGNNLRSIPYTRQLILQMTIPLIQNYPQWAPPRLRFWIWSMILYRCTLPTDPKDRRSELCMRNIEKIIKTSKYPPAFIVSALRAVESGEAVILEGFETKLHLAEPKPAAGYSIQRKWYDPSLYEEDTPGLPNSEHEQGQSDDAGHDLAEDEVEYQDNMTTAADRMRLYLRRANNLSTQAESPVLPYPKTLPLLYDTALQVLELCLTESYAKGIKIPWRRESELCGLARKALESYDYMIKRSVIPFVKALYNIMDEKDQFFQHFREEGTRNLLEYYLFESTR